MPKLGQSVINQVWNELKGSKWEDFRGTVGALQANNRLSGSIAAQMILEISRRESIGEIFPRTAQEMYYIFNY